VVRKTARRVALARPSEVEAFEKIMQCILNACDRV